MHCGENLSSYNASSGPVPPKKERETEETKETEEAEKAERTEEAETAKKSGRLSRKIKFILLAAAAAVIISAAGIYSQSAGTGFQPESADASAVSAADADDAAAEDSGTAADADGTAADDTSDGYPLLLASADDEEVCEQIEADYLAAFVEKINLAEENPFSAWTQYWYQAGLGSLVFQLSDPVFWEIEDDVYLGIYNETTCGFDFNGNIGIYYGHLKGLERSGSGIWISFYNVSESSADPDATCHMNYVYEGEWSNDLPNGEGASQEVFAYLGDKKGTALIHSVDIIFTDGLADGTGVFQYFDIDDIEEGDYETGECEVTAVSGKFEVISINEDGFETAAEIGNMGFSADTLNRLSVVVTQ